MQRNNKFKQFIDKLPANLKDAFGALGTGVVVFVLVGGMLKGYYLSQAGLIEKDVANNVGKDVGTYQGYECDYSKDDEVEIAVLTSNGKFVYTVPMDRYKSYCSGNAGQFSIDALEKIARNNKPVVEAIEQDVDQAE